MHKSTGRIFEADQKIIDELRRDLKTSDSVPLTAKQHRTIKPLSRNDRKGYMRNQPCACGSGKKFKKCCW